MIEEKKVAELAESHLAGSEVFLVEVQVRTGNRITVFIDGDHRVTVDDCRNLNLFLNEAMDRDREDFDLTVSSSGADRPLKLPRQYRKNTGRMLEIVTGDGKKFTATLVSAGEESLLLQAVPVKKQKTNPDIQPVSLRFDEIKSAKEVITFKP